jgi:hypothetical protein
MSLLEPREVWRAVNTLALGDSPEPPADVHTFEDAVVAVISGDTRSRMKGLAFLEDANRQAKIPWGSPTVFLVFYYHIVFELRDLQTGNELRKLLTNCAKLGSITSVDSQILQILLTGHSLLEAHLPRKALRSKTPKLGQVGPNSEPIIELIAGLVSAKLGGIVNLEPLVQATRKEITGFEVSEEVAEGYFVPIYASNQPFDNYFIAKAKVELERQSGRRALFQLRDETKAAIKEKTRGVTENRPLQVLFLLAFAGVGIALSVIYAEATTSPSVGSLPIFLVIAIASLFAITSLPISQMPKVALSILAYAYTIPDRVNLFYTNKNISELEELDEPQA